VIAVLAAVSEEIKSRSGTESNTEYFAALVSYTADCCFVIAMFSCYISMVLAVVLCISVSVTNQCFIDVAKRIELAFDTDVFFDPSSLKEGYFQHCSKL